MSWVALSLLQMCLCEQRDNGSSIETSGLPTAHTYVAWSQYWAIPSVSSYPLCAVWRICLPFSTLVSSSLSVWCWLRQHWGGGVMSCISILCCSIASGVTCQLHLNGQRHLSPSHAFTTKSIRQSFPVSSHLPRLRWASMWPWAVRLHWLFVCTENTFYLPFKH